ncbi:hypothetical protein LEP1GSC050_1792 [Leptospira broomii serovar Hurstbridge str. 5399]|uniref:HTH cro/C1-type domain-containing protein n=2 Tax=Leptospira broomii TaxID=301541 RepID=T0F6D6_9LEPT|nr:hypothetical protein LEP1GSC050_1792 [Leptospira broomii serovar Hurstbridge str. 5399]
MAAKVMGITEAALSMYKKGNREIPPARLDLLMQRFGISKKYILENKGEPIATKQEEFDLSNSDLLFLNSLKARPKLYEIVYDLAQLKDKELKPFQDLFTKLADAKKNPKKPASKADLRLKK